MSRAVPEPETIVPASQRSWTVGEWHVEPRANRLRRGLDSVTLVPKAMDALCVLIEHAGEPVADEVLMARVWADTAVSDASLYQVMSRLRRAFGDTGKPRRYIERISGRGYVLIAGVEAASEAEPRVAGGAGPSLTADPLSTDDRVDRMPAPSRRRRAARPAIVLIGCALLAAAPFVARRPELPGESVQRVAVLPFCLIGESADFYWVHGFADTLVTRLANVRDLEVVSGPSGAPLTGDAIGELAATLAVDTLVHGTIQEDERGLRVNVHLLDAPRADRVRARVIDGERGALFELQDRVARRVLEALRPASTDRRAGMREVDESTWQSYLLGRFHWSKRNGDSLQVAIRHFDEAIGKDARFALGYVGLCDSYHFQQEMPFPIEDDPAWRALRSHESAGRLRALLATNRRSTVDRAYDGIAKD